MGLGESHVMEMVEGRCADRTSRDQWAAVELIHKSLSIIVNGEAKPIFTAEVVVHTAIIGVFGIGLGVKKREATDRIGQAAIPVSRQTISLWRWRIGSVARKRAVRIDAGTSFIGGHRRTSADDRLSERAAVRLQVSETGGGWHESIGLCRSCTQLNSIVGKGEESFISPNWAIDFAAKLVANVFGLWQAFTIRKEIFRVQGSVAVELVECSVKLVGTGLLIGTDHGACGSAVLSAHTVGNDGKVLDGLERRMNVNCALAEIIVVVSTVEQVRSTRLSRTA